MAWPSLASRTKDWGTETLTDSDLEGQFDLIFTYINDMMDSTAGHKHDATTAEGPKILINNLTIASRAQGDVYYDNGTNPTRLAAGTSGHFLKTQGAGANPTWAAVGFQTAATQAEMEAATIDTAPVTPVKVKFHPGVAKAWIRFNGTGTPAAVARYNTDTSITDNGSGDWTIAITTDLGDANGVISGSAGDSTHTELPSFNARAIAAGTVRVVTCGLANSLVDVDQVSVVVHGDFA